MKILITGGGRGIGAAIVKLYTDKGHDVDRPTRQELDLADPDKVRRFADEKNAEGGYDVIVNNAGCNYIHEVGELDDGDMSEMMQVNLISPIQLLNGLVPSMKDKGGGRIVNIGSIWGCISKPGRSVYSATKHGIHGITMTLALELAPYGILVNTVAPGQTMTELTLRNNPPEAIEMMKRDIPLGRLAESQEIARVVYWLGSDENTYITGQQIVVDGGLTAR